MHSHIRSDHGLGHLANGRKRVKQMGEYLLVAILYVDNLIILACNPIEVGQIRAQEGILNE